MRTTLSFVIALTVAATSAVFAQTPNPALKIVVIEGEDAVNIIQQKTAVAPIVEVRDRNNLPVSGASVTFAVTGPGASFAGGAPTITVVTNAAGQATAAGLTPTAAGAIHVSATATFEGQTAIATITQSNVLTAAEAASTTAGATSGTTGSPGGGAGGGAGGAAGGSGAGLSATTIGIIGAAAGGGALVAAKAAGGGEPSPVSTGGTTSATATVPPTTTTPAPTTPAPAPQPTSAAYSGPMDGSMNGTSTVTFTGEPNTSCTFTMRMTGTASIRLQTSAAGAITGTLDLNGRQVVTTSTCGELSGVIGDEPFVNSAPVEGSAGTIRFTQEFRDSGSVPGASWTTTATVNFTGTVSSSGVTGTLTYNTVGDIRGDGFTSRATWTGTIPINLR